MNYDNECLWDICLVKALYQMLYIESLLSFLGRRLGGSYSFPILQIRTQRLRQITKLIQVYIKLARVEASVQTQKCLSPKPESGPQTLTPRLHWEARGSPAHSWLTDHICRTDLQWKPSEGMSYPRETLSQWPGETERLRQLPCILSKDNKTGI